MNFLHDSLEHKDLTVITAVLGASPFVSGIDREQHALLRGLANQKFAPREAQQADALRSVRKTISTALNSFGEGYFARLPRMVEDKPAAALSQLKRSA